jgi:hypothetical protein
VRWVDKTHVTLFLPDRDAWSWAATSTSCPACRCGSPSAPGESDDPRGQFDDVIWVQVARAMMGTLALEAAYMAVQAPIAVPTTWKSSLSGRTRSSSPTRPRHPPRAARAAADDLRREPGLDNEMKLGSRYPDARTGGVQASVITGKGVEALLGTFDTQIKGAQMVMREALQQVTSICFEMDEKWWPNETKQINGTLSGSSYQLSYMPGKDISGRYDCTVTYGFAAGMHPAQSIVTMLQLVGAGVIAKTTFQENLPFQIDALQEKRKIDVGRRPRGAEAGHVLGDPVGRADGPAGPGPRPVPEARGQRHQGHTERDGD